MGMESSISTFCKSLASFCNHVQTCSQSLSDSIQRRAIPLDSAASSFMQWVDRRISSTSGDLNLLESMVLGTVSVEELLGHCNEVYKANQKHISELEDRMRSFGYVPELEFEFEDCEDLVVDSKLRRPKNGSDSPSYACGSVSAARSSRKRIEEDPIFEDSISLHNLGLSDACLATLASEDSDNATSPKISLKNVLSPDDGLTHGKEVAFEPPKDVSIVSSGAIYGSSTRTMIEVSKDDYDNLPSYIKNLASWEELMEAVIKMNYYLCKKDGANGSDTLNQDDLETIGLGRKGRSYLLILLRLNQLIVETVDGSILYRVRA